MQVRARRKYLAIIAAWGRPFVPSDCRPIALSAYPAIKLRDDRIAAADAARATGQSQKEIRGGVATQGSARDGNRLAIKCGDCQVRPDADRASDPNSDSDRRASGKSLPNSTMTHLKQTYERTQIHDEWESTY